jgi:hypothetical protein
VKMNRRGFLSVITIGAVAAPAAAMGVKASSDPSDAPISDTTLSITSGVKKSNNSSVFFHDQYEEYKTVNMSVGKDGNLWIKTEDGHWKRIVTE